MLDLTGFPALDLAIGLSFVFFLLAILASALHELIASFFGLRARTLEEGLRNMLEDGSGGTDLVKKFYKDPLIYTLFKGDKPELEKSPADRKRTERTKGPSYVSPRAFALFMLNNMAPGEEQTGKTVFDAAKENVNTLPPAVRERIKPLIASAENDVERLRTALEAWYDDTMARVSGWYKRKSQVILLVLGAALVIALNANTLTIGDRLWSDAAVRAAVVQQAAKASAEPDGDNAKEKLQNAAANVAGVAKLGVPLGWSGEAKPDRTFRGAIGAVVGWLLTIAAISLGAPFWFDALSRLSRLRSSGKPETPLPASGSGKPNERVSTARREAELVVHIHNAPET